jgi:uncharacterized protein (DUF2267 family)
MKEAEFLARVQERGGLASPKEARRWSIAVLRALADLLPDPQAKRHFLSQLPGTLKAALREEPPRTLLMDRDALVQHTAAMLDAHAREGERALTTVYGVVRDTLSPGQIAAFEARIPKEIRAFLERAS